MRAFGGLLISLATAMPCVAENANYEIISTGARAIGAQYRGGAILINNVSGKVYVCTAAYISTNRALSAKCDEQSGWRSALPLGPKSTSVGPFPTVTTGAALVWQVDQTTGKAQVCYLAPRMVAGDNCIDVTPP